MGLKSIYRSRRQVVLIMLIPASACTVTYAISNAPMVHCLGYCWYWSGVWRQLLTMRIFCSSNTFWQTNRQAGRFLMA